MSANTQGIIRNGELENGLELIKQPLASYADVYDRIFREVPVIDEKGNFVRINGGFGSEVNVGDFLRSPGGSYNEIDVSYTSVTGWRLNDVGLASKVDKRQLRVQGGGSVRRLNLQQDSLNLMMQELSIARAFIGLSMLVGGTLTNNAAMTTTRFDDNSTDIQAVVNAQVSAFEDQEGVSPNKIAVRIDVARALAKHTQLVENWSRTQTSMGRVTGVQNKAGLEAFIADLFGADDCVVVNARYNSANAGQTESKGLMWADSLVMYYDQAVLSPRTPNAALVRYQGTEDGAAATRGQFMNGEVMEWEDRYNIYNSVSHDEQYSVPRVGLARLLTDCVA